MHPHLLEVPLYVLIAVFGALLGASLLGESKKPALPVLVGMGGAVITGLFAHSQSWGLNPVPIQSYGMMILLGFLAGVWAAARRGPLVGVAPKHFVDIGVYGVIVGIAGARGLHIALNWATYTPFLESGFSIERIGKMFKIWEAGLDFFGAFVTVVPGTYLYCRYHKIPGLVMLDLATPSLILGQGIGRLGCFLFGCCFGKLSDAAWAVQFPPGSPAYFHQVDAGLLRGTESCSLAVHPTQLYACISGLLTWAVMYAYWPQRRRSGVIFSATILASGVMRFLEELLRADEPPWLSAVPWMTAAHYFALGAIVVGAVLLWHSSRRGPEVIHASA